MDEKQKKTLFAAILRLLRPLVRILLRNGVPFRGFAELAKWVYVDVARKEFGLPGRKLSDSRVSIITGLTRKEVRRLGRLERLDDATELDRYNRASRVITGWVRDPAFQEDGGHPRSLPFDGDEISFSALVRTYGGDVPARAVLDELRNVGAVETDAGGRIRLLTRAYVPRGEAPEKLAIMGTDVADLLSTIDHNIRGGRPPFFQRKVAYDNLPEEAVEEFRELTALHAQELLERLDRWLARRDRDVNPNAGGTGRKRLGLGIYYFEDDVEDEDADEGGAA